MLAISHDREKKENKFILIDLIVLYKTQLENIPNIRIEMFLYPLIS